MRARLAIAISICVGLGVAAWVERDRVAGLSALLQPDRFGSDADAAGSLPHGGVPESPPDATFDPGPDHPDGVKPSLETAALPQSLDGLFAALREADTAEQAQQIEARIYMRLGTSPSGTVNALMEAAARAESIEDWARARAVYADVTRIDPGFADGWARAASSAWQMGDHAKARDDLLQALRLEPRHFAAWAGLATIYEETGYLVEADQAWRE
ncbi:MAG: hypothetical protein MUF14_10410, partial [Hyphomonadaceae bacterium]|nr:hypothetical protein [Hyphomonadaceae bacterium]